MSNPLQSIPPTVRKYLYLTYAILGLVLGGLQVYGIQHLGDFDVSKGLEVLAYIGIPLGFTAASNLPSYEDVVEGDAPPPDAARIRKGEQGQTSVVTVLLVVLLVIVILALFGLLR